MRCQQTAGGSVDISDIDKELCMTAKKATFAVLELFKPGDTFTGESLSTYVYFKTHEYHYPATTLRYMREYRVINGVSIPCINKAKSMYQMGEKQ